MNFAYWTMLAFLFVHELDAVRRHEWRVLPLTSFLSERLGATVFVWAHVPLFMLIFWFGSDAGSVFAKCVSVFAIIHVGLHLLFCRHRYYEFNNVGSWALILVAGVAGAVHLGMSI